VIDVTLTVALLYVYIGFMELNALNLLSQLHDPFPNFEEALGARYQAVVQPRKPVYTSERPVLRILPSGQGVVYPRAVVESTLQRRNEKLHWAYRLGRWTAQKLQQLGFITVTPSESTAAPHSDNFTALRNEGNLTPTNPTNADQAQPVHFTQSRSQFKFMASPQFTPNQVGATEAAQQLHFTQSTSQFKLPPTTKVA